MSKRIVYVIVIFCSIVVGFSFGLGYGTENDLQYLIEGLRLVDPSYLQSDWFATQTTPYHHNFGYIVYALSQFGSRSWNLSILNACLIALGMFFIFKWVQAITARHVLPIFLLILCFVILFKTRDVAYSFLFGSVLQPSSFAGAFFVIALSLFISGHFTASGVLLALAGWFHTNFLLLGFPLFFFGHVALGKDSVVKRLLQQLGPSLIVLAISMPVLLGMSTSAHGAEARRIFLTIRSPGHYYPRGYLGDFISYIGWQILACISLTGIKMEKASGKRFVMIYFSSFGLVTVATLLTTVVFIPFISQLFFWRLGPISTLCAQTLIVLAVVQCLTEPVKQFRMTRGVVGKIVGMLVGLGLVLFGIYRPGSSFAARLGYYWDKASLILFLAIGLTVFSLYILRHVRDLKSVSQILLSIAVISFAITSLATARVAYWDSTVLTLESARQEEMQLYHWAQTTPKQSLFIIPPALVYFRFHGERAIIVDWFSTPMAPDQVLEWYRRLGAICGNNQIKSRAEAEQAYATMDQARLDTLRREFGANYVVFRKESFHAEAFALMPIVFSNSQFVVLELDPK
jgi:hypothetical protein